MRIWCCECKVETQARLTDGGEVYPDRADLKELPFWICDTCKNYISCHHKTKNRTRPKGCIPSEEIKNARIHIHNILDPIWKSGRISRSAVYKKISDFLGYEYHTAEIRDMEEARRIYRFIRGI